MSIPAHKSSEQGFTLIELMVVITIIGLLSAVVVLTVPDPRGRVLEDAERMAARASAIRDMAVVEARPTAIWIDTGGYGFERRRDGQWTALNDKPFANTRWKSGNSALTGGTRQRVVFDNLGLADHALTVPVIGNGQRVGVRIGDDGKVKVVG